MNTNPLQGMAVRTAAFVLVVCLQLVACGLDPGLTPVAAPANQPVVTPIPISCQRELQPGEDAGGGVAYSPVTGA